MFEILAQSDTTPEGLFHHVLNLMEIYVQNPIALGCTVSVAAIVVAGLMNHRFKVRQAELDASLKADMIQRGMSVEEIERVLSAKSDARYKQTTAYRDSSAK